MNKRSRIKPHKARKRFGQNFLQDSAVIQQIIAAINPRQDEYLIEIGPGKGALTQFLVENCQKLDVIELDRDLIPRLKAGFATHDQSLRIINADVLDIDFCQLSREQGQNARVVGNLPYNISTTLLMHLIGFRECIEDMFFMLQKEVVARICAQPGTHDYGRLSILMQYYFHCEKLFEVAPEAFRPIPAVDSAIIHLQAYAQPEQQHGARLLQTQSLSQITRLCFASRRKTLANNLKSWISAAQIAQLGIDPGLRAEQLRMADFIRLANIFQNL